MHSIPNSAYRRSQCIRWEVPTAEPKMPTSRCRPTMCPNLAVPSVSRLTLPYGLRAARDARKVDDRTNLSSTLMRSAFHRVPNAVVQIYVLVQHGTTKLGDRSRTPGDKEDAFCQKQTELEKAAQVLDKTRRKPLSNSPEHQAPEVLQWYWENDG